MCFIRYASTKELGSKNSKLSPIKVNTTTIVVFKEIHQYLLKNAYEEVSVREDYLDLFGIKNNFEISFNILSSEGKSYVAISVYSEKRRLSTKKVLNNVYEEIENLLERYM